MIRALLLAAPQLRSDGSDQRVRVGVGAQLENGCPTSTYLILSLREKKSRCDFGFSKSEGRCEIPTYRPIRLY